MNARPDDLEEAVAQFEAAHAARLNAEQRERDVRASVLAKLTRPAAQTKDGSSQ